MSMGRDQQFFNFVFPVCFHMNDSSSLTFVVTILRVEFLLSNVTDYPLRRYRNFRSISLVVFALPMIIVLCCAFRNKIKNDVTNHDPRHLSFGGNLHQRENQSSSTTLRLLRCHHIIHQVFSTLIAHSKVY